MPKTNLFGKSITKKMWKTRTDAHTDTLHFYVPSRHLVGDKIQLVVISFPNVCGAFLLKEIEHSSKFKKSICFKKENPMFLFLKSTDSFAFSQYETENGFVLHCPFQHGLERIKKCAICFIK